MEGEASFGKAYDFIADFLVDRVYYFYVFPLFFLKIAREKDSEIYFDMLYDRAIEKSKDKEYVERLENLVNIYQNEVEKLREKSDILATILDAKDPLEFFQKMMEQQNFSNFNSLSIERVKELKNKSINLNEVLSEINLKI